MARLFFALWPDDIVRARLTSVMDQLPERLGRRVPLRNIHITLVFLGEVTEDVAQGLLGDASKVCAEPFSLVLDHSGWWRGPRVVWLGAEAVPEPLAHLVEQISAVARSHGLQLEERPFRAHLTIARKVARHPRPIRFAPIHWQINEFCLMESTQQENGSVYDVRGRWPLTRG